MKAGKTELKKNRNKKQNLNQSIEDKKITNKDEYTFFLPV